VDLGPVGQFNLTVCLGKEWFRFPGHYYVPGGVGVEFVKSEFAGALPGHFLAREREGGGSGFWWRDGTRMAHAGLNDLNQEIPEFYVRPSSNPHLVTTVDPTPPKVPPDTCDYLIDLDFPLHPRSTPLEPRYATDLQTWDRVICVPFLDASRSSLLTRTMWMPGGRWESGNEWGDYCLLRNRELVGGKEEKVRGMRMGSL
jgi:alpha-1,2-mannosyltransferase